MSSQKLVSPSLSLCSVADFNNTLRGALDNSLREATDHCFTSLFVLKNIFLLFVFVFFLYLFFLLRLFHSLYSYLIQETLTAGFSCFSFKKKINKMMDS